MNQSFPCQIVCNAGSDFFLNSEVGYHVTANNQMGNTLSGILTGVLRAGKGLI